MLHIMNPVLTPEMALIFARGEELAEHELEAHQSYQGETSLYFDDGIDVLGLDPIDEDISSLTTDEVNPDDFLPGTPLAEMILRNAGYKSAEDVEEPRVHMVYVTLYDVFTRHALKLRVMRDQIKGDLVLS